MGWTALAPTFSCQDVVTGKIDRDGAKAEFHGVAQSKRRALEETLLENP
jgi:hypothetical protein